MRCGLWHRQHLVFVWTKHSPEPEVTKENAMQAFMAIREKAEKDFLDGMSLDEINDEIRKARCGEEDEE